MPDAVDLDRTVEDSALALYSRDHLSNAPAPLSTYDYFKVVYGNVRKRGGAHSQSQSPTGSREYKRL